MIAVGGVVFEGGEELVFVLECPQSGEGGVGVLFGEHEDDIAPQVEVPSAI